MREDKSLAVRILIATAWGAVFLFLLFLFFALFEIFGIGGQFGSYTRQAAGGGPKLVVSAILVLSTMICAFVFLRHSIEDLGLIPKEDEFVDWRQEIHNEILDGPALSNHAQTALGWNRGGTFRNRTRLRNRRHGPRRWIESPAFGSSRCFRRPRQRKQTRTEVRGGGRIRDGGGKPGRGPSRWAGAAAASGSSDAGCLPIAGDFAVPDCGR